MPKKKESDQILSDTPLTNLQEYNFPEYGITILATDMQDALAKLHIILNSQSK